MCKPDGYILNSLGLFYGPDNDSSTIEIVFAENSGIKTILKANDDSFVNRDFLDAVQDITD